MFLQINLKLGSCLVTIQKILCRAAVVLTSCEHFTLVTRPKKHISATLKIQPPNSDGHWQLREGLPGKAPEGRTVNGGSNIGESPKDTHQTGN